MLDGLSSTQESPAQPENMGIETNYATLLSKITKGNIRTPSEWEQEFEAFQRSLDQANITPAMKHAMLSTVTAAAMITSEGFRSIDKVASTKPDFQEYSRFLYEIISTPPNSVKPGWRWSIGPGIPLKSGLFTRALDTKWNPAEVHKALPSTPVRSTPVNK